MDKKDIDSPDKDQIAATGGTARHGQGERQGSSSSGLRKKRAAKAALLAAVLLMLLAGAYLLVGYDSDDGSDQALVAEYAGEAGRLADEALDTARDGEAAAAVTMIEEYLAADPAITAKEESYLYWQLSAIHARSGAADPALESIEKAIDIYPEDPRYYLYAAQFYQGRGDDDSASELYETALRKYDEGPPEGYQGPEREFFAQHVSGGE